MAYSVSCTLAVSTATPKVNQNVTVTATVDNSGGTVPVSISSVQGAIATPSNAAASLGSCVVGKSEAGAADVPAPVTVAAGATQTFTFGAVLFAAGAITVGCVASGTRSDTGAQITVPAASAVTITAS